MPIEGYLRTKDVAKKLKVSVGRIQQLIADKKLKAIKVGQTNLVKISDLELFEKGKIGRPKKDKK